MPHTLMFREGILGRDGITKGDCLVVYYSRTGTTQAVARQVAFACNCDIDEIIEPQSRMGIRGYLRSGYQALTQALPTIKPFFKDPTSYGLIILGTPVWAGNIAAPMRSYIMQNRSRFRQIATFCTMSGSDGGKVLQDIDKLCGKPARARLVLTGDQVSNTAYMEDVARFALTLADHKR